MRGLKRFYEGTLEGSPKHDDGDNGNISSYRQMDSQINVFSKASVERRDLAVGIRRAIRRDNDFQRSSINIHRHRDERGSKDS